MNGQEAQPIDSLDVQGGIFTLSDLKWMLDTLNKKGQVQITNVKPGSVDMLMIGAAMYVLGNKHIDDSYGRL